MPTYDYKCIICDKTYEYFHKMTESPVYTCPVCGDTLKKMIGSGSSPIFKGSGFYQTDYKNKSDKSYQSKLKGSTDIKKD
jgi:putative FmdB family regulatory protein